MSSYRDGRTHQTSAANAMQSAKARPPAASSTRPSQRGGGRRNGKWMEVKSKGMGDDF